VGTNKPVTVSGYTAPGGNYSLAQPTGLTASILSAAPIAGPDTLVADPNPNIVSKISIAELLANDSEPNNGTSKVNLVLTVNTNSLPSGYGTMRVRGGWVSYQPPANWPVPASIKTTAFTYILSNTNNLRSTTNTVTVSLTRENAIPINNFSIRTNVIPPVAIFSVLPNQRFEVEKSLNLTNPIWQILSNPATTPATGTHTSDANGWLQVPDPALTNNGVSSGYYRLRWAA